MLVSHQHPWKRKKIRLLIFLKIKGYVLLRLIDINKWANFRCWEWDVFITHYNFQLLPSNTIWSWPKWVIFLKDLRVFNDSFKFIQNTLMNICLKTCLLEKRSEKILSDWKNLFSDHGVIFVVGIVGVSQFAC